MLSLSLADDVALRGAGMLAAHLRTAVGVLPAADAGMAFVVADDVLLPERAGQKAS